MAKITFRLTLPKVNEQWWQSSKSELQRIVEDYNKENWAAQTDPVDGSPWAPRKQPTGGWPILNRTGKMFGSTKFKSAGKMLFSASVGVKYGGFHMTGTSKMPQRRWLGIGEEVVPRMEKVIAKHCFKGKVTLRIP